MKIGSHNNAKIAGLQRILGFLPPKKMKTSYKRVFYLLFTFAIVLSILSYFSLLGCDFQAASLIEILTGLAIAVTAVIALSNADLPKEKVKVDIQTYITKDTENWQETYEKKDLKPDLCKFFTNCRDPIKSYKVQFEIKNISNFDWVKPVITFRLPTDRQAPDTEEKKIIIQCHNGQVKPVPSDEGNHKYTIRRYHSNAFNPLAGGQVLEMVDGVVMSTTNLPHWPKDWSMTIWIRMVLDLENTISEKFDVQISLDSENAKGFTRTSTIDPKNLLSNVREQRQ